HAPCPGCGSLNRDVRVLDRISVSGDGLVRSVGKKRLTEMGFHLTWKRLVHGWLVEVRDDSGTVIESGVGDDKQDV
ncbi:MAG: hypothetical protein M3404_09795, partial [Actinomycetota bacterium]|nr:hypothetical protein [Actinomycetota bacterium]